MITINYNLASILNGLFWGSHWEHFRYNSGINWSDNNVLSRFVKCDLNALSEFEVPIIISHYAQKALISFTRRPSEESHVLVTEKEIVVPLIQQDYTNNRRTSNSILRLLLDGNIQDGLVVAKTSKGDKYYGARGCIFNADFNPILLTTKVGHFDTDIRDDVPHKIIWTEYRVYIHSSVFIEDSLLGKCILKKVIPYMLGDAYALPKYNRNIQEYINDNIKVKVIVEDTSRFFRTPTLESNFSDGAINDMLVANVEDVINQIKI